MSTYSWTTGTNGVWGVATNWAPATVPPDDVATPGTADVTIDAVPTGVAYTVTIPTGTSETIDSLTVNGTNPNLSGSNSPTYNAAEIVIDGTLVFAPGSAGLFGGSLQTYLGMNGGTIVNAGTVNAFVQTTGNVLFTGTNGIYFTNELQALGGTITIDPSVINERTGNTLFDGIYDVQGVAAAIDLGGTATGIVNITTLEGPPLNPGGWTELTFNDPTASINEWNGTAYAPIENTLTEIAGAGTVDVLDGSDFNTGTNTLSVDAGTNGIVQGLLYLQAGTVTTASLDINGGIVQGYATIAGPVVNDGTLIAVGGTLTLNGSLSGSGTVEFDFDDKAGTVDAAGATLSVEGVASGQTIVMNGTDTLVVNAPGSFAGTISAGVGDTIILTGVTATSASINSGTLVAFDGTVAVGSLAVAGTYVGDHVAVSGSDLTFASGTSGPSISGAVAGQAVADTGTIAPFSGVSIADSNVGQAETVTVRLSSAANGVLSNLGGGSYDATTGVYTDTGSATAVTAALAGLVFTPAAHEVAPGGTVTTTFSLTDIDTGLATASDGTTSVIAIAGTASPTITGSVAGQTVADTGSIAPFSGVAIGDANFGQTETVTVTLSSAANGTLSNLGSGSYDATTGVYTDVGSASAVTTDLDGLVFNPTTGEVPTGQTVTTGFTISGTDTAGVSATDSTTSVIASGSGSTVGSAPPPSVPSNEVVLSGPSTDYIIADDNGSLYLDGPSGAQVLPGVDVIQFNDGVGVFDPTGTAEDIARLYQAALDRAPDVPGLLALTADVDNSNVPLSAIANAFVSSPEFIQDYGSLSNAAFVEQLYQNALGRSADPAGLQNYVGLLNSGVSRGAVLLAAAENQESYADSLSTAGNTNNAEVYRLYEATVDRAPDPSGLATYSAALASGVTPTQIAQDFLNSAEFQSDYGTLSNSAFVTQLYENAAHRAPDAGGLASYTAALTAGASRASVAVAFADSLESRAITAGATHANWVFIPG